MQVEKDKLKERLAKRKAELEDLGSSQPIYIAKIRKLVLERTPSVWLDNHSIRRLSMINNGDNQPPAEARSRDGIIPAERLTVWTKGNRGQILKRKAF